MLKVKVEREGACGYITDDRSYGKTGKFETDNLPPLDGCVPAPPDWIGNLLYWRFFGDLAPEELACREPPGDPATANIFTQEETGEVLVELLALGVPAWILCRREALT